jgi:Phage tail sheath protein subtilisin-like domain/Phage tail sheath C-terminal domain
LFDNYSGNSYSGFSFDTHITGLEMISEQYLFPNCAGFFSFSGDGISGDINYNTNTIQIVYPSSADPMMFSAVSVTFSACSDNVTLNAVTLNGSTPTTIDFTTGTTCGTSGYSLTFVVVSPNSAVTESWTVCVTLDNPCSPIPSGNTGMLITGLTEPICYSGTMVGTIYYYSGTAYSDYNNLVVATLRSRGISEYSSTADGPIYEVSALSAVTLDFSGTYSAVETNPFAEFAIMVTNDGGKNFVFETSLQTSDAHFLDKVFGRSNFAKPRTDVPLYVEEDFSSMLQWAYNKGYIRGLRQDLVSLPGARSNDSSSIGFYGEQYQTPQSPWLVSELRGTKVYRLFRFTSIADGNSANDQIKISIMNLSFNNMTFDVLIRDFYDTDASPVVLEKYTNCSMDSTLNNFVARKIGSVEGDYPLVSNYVMVEMNEDAPMDSLPCGFEGYNFRNYDSVTSPFPIFKTKYDYPGEVVYDPPFGYSNGKDNPVVSSGDNVRRTYLGISDSVGYDLDFYQYVCKQNINTTCDPVLQEWNYVTKGFHMDSGATVVTISSGYTTSGQSAFFVGAGSFTSEPQDTNNPYYYLYSRKFSLLVAGGFDGWDVYREYRTNGDTFALGANGYLKGACPSSRYPSATGTGSFKRITIGNNTQDWANTDYYAYLLGQQTMSNPEAVNINVFVTPGIDYVNNSNLVEAGIEMIEYNRADSLYICTTPDYNMFVPTTTNNSIDLIYPQEAVDNLIETGIDSNYTATYYPWVLTLDTVNNTQVYIPATAEVTRNLALTDNIAFPWFASAGYTRGIVNAVKARKKLTQEDRDILYQGRINPIATFSDVGTVIWGNKTLQVADSALNRINVRRLLLQARKLISAVSVRLLFEQNDDKVRQDFLDAVNPILDSIRRDRGLYDFRVTVSNDPADLDRNQLTGKVYIKPTKSLEFIDIEFLITPTGASFENI